MGSIVSIFKDTSTYSVFYVVFQYVSDTSKVICIAYILSALHFIDFSLWLYPIHRRPLLYSHKIRIFITVNLMTVKPKLQNTTTDTILLSIVESTIQKYLQKLYSAVSYVSQEQTTKSEKNPSTNIVMENVRILAQVVNCQCFINMR